MKAAGLVVSKFPSVRFVMVGLGLSDSNAQLTEWIRSTGHPNRFTLLRFRSDIRICYAGMDVFCLSSRSEGFPNVVGEAMSAGLPCVVTNVGDASLIVADTGIVVDKADEFALADGLSRMVKMPSELRRSLGRQAKARMQQHFTITRTRERFEEIYDAARSNAIVAETDMAVTIG